MHSKEGKCNITDEIVTVNMNNNALYLDVLYLTLDLKLIQTHF